MVRKIKNLGHSFFFLPRVVYYFSPSVARKLARKRVFEIRAVSPLTKSYEYGINKNSCFV